jgi:hypothetical protein
VEQAEVARCLFAVEQAEVTRWLSFAVEQAEVTRCLSFAVEQAEVTRCLSFAVEQAEVTRCLSFAVEQAEVTRCLAVEQAEVTRCLSFAVEQAEVTRCLSFAEEQAEVIRCLAVEQAEVTRCLAVEQAEVTRCVFAVEQAEVMGVKLTTHIHLVSKWSWSVTSTSLCILMAWHKEQEQLHSYNPEDFDRHVLSEHQLINDNTPHPDNSGPVPYHTKRHPLLPPPTPIPAFHR